MDKIPLSKPDITDLEIKAVIDVLKSPCLSLGPKVEEFEKLMADYIGRKYAIAVNSGTSALHLIIRALGIKENHEVITSPFSFISSSNCILYEKAKPVFVDIDAKSLNIDPLKIEEKITEKTKAILAVDVFGVSADWNKLEQIAEKHNLLLIEDSAEALGSEYNGKKCGSFGKASIFSFYPNKQITTAGEGGIILTDDEETADLCYSMRNQGRKQENNKWLEHVCLGYNYRMPEVCAAMGIVQLKRIDKILEKRNKVAFLYNEKLKHIKGIQVPDNSGTWFVYVIKIDKRYERDKIIKQMAEKGIQCSNYFYPIHLQPFYKQLFNYKQGDFQISEDVSQRTIALPFYNDLSEKEIEFIVETLSGLL